MPKTLGSLPTRSKIKFEVFRNKPIKWLIVEKNHSGYPSGAVTLLTEKIIKLMPSDAKEPNSSDSSRKSYGNNRYIYSNIRKWLNSIAGPGAWYSAAHSTDAPPSAANVWVSGSAINPYDTIAGFMNEFSPEGRTSILDTPLTVGRASVDGGGTETFVDKIFLLSPTEVGLSGDVTEGSKLEYFSDNQSRIAVPDADCLADNNYTNSGLSTINVWYWWLRSPYVSNSCSVRNVDTDGTPYVSNAYDGSVGLRPALNLPSSLLVSDNVDAEGYYTALFNEAPLAPNFINVPAAAYGTININWASTTDPDGIITGYHLERKYDNGSWVEIYSGMGLNYGDEISRDYDTVQYRVRAIDDKGSFSPYVTSEISTILQNPPPVISLEDGDLGVYSGIPPSVIFTISETNSPAIRIDVRLNDVQISQLTGNVNGDNIVTIPMDVWKKTLNGIHYLILEIIDSYGNIVTRTLTFQKSVTEIKFVLENPLEANDRPNVIVATVIGSMPDGSTLLVEVCNNGNDDEPVWEDMTVQAKTRQKYFFQNTEKEAEEWGVNIRVTLKRGTAELPVFITSVGGNFA